MPLKDRYKSFRYLDNRSVEAFKLLPIEYEKEYYHEFILILMIVMIMII